MTDQNWLRDGLADAVPTPPDAPERAANARGLARRARRRTRLVIGGVAASVLVVAGAVAFIGGDDNGPKADDNLAAAPYDAPDCPATPVDSLTTGGPGDVPDGATSVRLCAGPGNPVELPLDALVTDVDEVAAVVNGLAPAPADQVCTMELGPGYALVFAYPGGSTVAASGALYGCGDVTVNGVQRKGAVELLDAFIGSLRSQREQLTPGKLDTSRIDCQSSVGAETLGRPQDLTVASLCIGDARGHDGLLAAGARRTATITSSDLDLLLADMAANTGEAGIISCALPSPSPLIVGLTPWGDRVVIRAECGHGWFDMSETTGPYFPPQVWQPGPEAQALIDRLVGEAR